MQFHTSGAIKPRTARGRLSMRKRILSPVNFAPYVFLTYTSRKWAENSRVIVIMDVSVTTP